MKPLYRGPHRDVRTVSHVCVRYIDVLPKLAYFPSKTCYCVSGYGEINPKMCQDAGVGRRKSLKAIYLRTSCLCNNLEATESATHHIVQECCCCDSY